MTPRIAVVDDERRMVEILSMILRKEGYAVSLFTSSHSAAEALREERFDLLLTDLKMPAPDGLELLAIAKAAHRDMPVILLTAHATVTTAIAAIREGAFDYIEKPFDNDGLKALVARALEVERLTRENRYLRGEIRARHPIDDIVAESQAMRDVLDLVRRAAPSSSTVLITGASGTGKELIARAIHYQSERVGAPFVAVNCKAFASGVLESELFGHEKGAFTGATSQRAGLFEQAHRGTLFLDEIGDIDGEFQAKLLRVLQEKTLRRVGGDAVVAVDVRIVAATHRDLKAEVQADRFREDLYFRLAVIPIEVSPLRTRQEDILPLAELFLEKYGHELDGWSEQAASRMLAYDWPGNVRELENTIERASVLAPGPVLEVDDLMLEDERPAPSETTGLREFLDHATEAHIRGALAATSGRRAEAAERLGIDRVTLYRLMRKFSLP